MMEAEKITQEIRTKFGEILRNNFNPVDLEYAVGELIISLKNRGDIKILDEKELPKNPYKDRDCNIAYGRGQQEILDSLKDFTV